MNRASTKGAGQMNEPKAINVLLLGCCLLLLIGFFASTIGDAQSPTAEPVLGRTCWMEAGFSLNDCAAIVWVLKRQARRVGDTAADRARQYSAIKANNERAAFARQLPAGDEPTWNAATNNRWRELRKVARQALAGRIADPCDGATDWGSPILKSDVERAMIAIEAGRWRFAVCTQKTFNVFYSEVR
jgi:hypothetical protein